MAEEFDIQSVWKKSKEKESTNSLQINMMERKGTKTTLYWIKTILWIEFWLSIVLVPIVMWFLHKNGDPAWLKIFYIVTSIVYLIYYQFLIRKINEFRYDGNVVHSLRKVYGYLRFYLLHYKVVIWVSMIFGLVYGFIAPENQQGLSKLETTNQWLMAIGVSAIIVLIVGGIMHFLVHLIYGRKIKRLRRMVRDLEVQE